MGQAGSTLLALSGQLEKADPWDALKKAETILEALDADPANRYSGIAKTGIRLAMEAHRRFQKG